MTVPTEAENISEARPTAQLDALMTARRIPGIVAQTLHVADCTAMYDMHAPENLLAGTRTAYMYM